MHSKMAPLTAIEHVRMQVELFSWKVKLGDQGGWSNVSGAAGAVTVLFSTILEQESVFCDRPRARSRSGERTCPTPKERDDASNDAAAYGDLDCH